LIPNPIRKVRVSIRARRVKALLMGGQACVFYGAAEFSRDTDFAILADAANLTKLRAALFANNAKPDPAQIKFWLMELRTPELLLETAQSHALVARRLAAKRPLLQPAYLGEFAQLESALAAEEYSVRAQDKAYWLPLRQELERLRHSK
jgi:hypothetical protein